jgi:hypothetical protein
MEESCNINVVTTDHLLNINKMAKQIQPMNVWVNGEIKTAEYLDAYGTNVTLGKSAQFYWVFFTKTVNDEGENVPGEQIVQGNLIMDGADYQAWEQDDVAWNFVASKLNVTIIL